MYRDFFGFSEKPFTITPNPHFIYLSGNHREAFAHLLYGIDSHAGFIAMTGEVGTGKTTVLRTLLTQLDPEKYCSALIFNPCLSGDQLLASICREFGVDADAHHSYGYLDALNHFLLEQHSAGKTVVLVVDEAQNLAPDVLEQVRMISNLETECDKLIQIILAGQPELDDVLQRRDLRQLSQRITIRCRLTPMNRRDTGDYIRHRLRVSGCRLPALFTSGAVKRIYRFSRGVPRLINILCEQALVLAWTQESSTVTSAIASRVIGVTQLRPKRMGVWQRLHGWLWSGR
ncbi:MAG: AAA family ATPase [Geobacteraceae bacterium]|nr:AAA family ATPase [Geobacteraceae bacterium]